MPTLTTSHLGGAIKFPALLRRSSTRESGKTDLNEEVEANESKTETARSRRLSKRVRHPSLFSLGRPPSPSFAPDRDPMPPLQPLLESPDILNRVLEEVLQYPNGRRALSKLARTCRALQSPALDLLWRDLDSLIPIIALFPSSLLRRSKKPGLGFVKEPNVEDWDAILPYRDRVKRLEYDENLNNVASTIFPLIEAYSARTSKALFPNLNRLTWRIDTPKGLEHGRIFLSNTLKALELEVRVTCPKLNIFLMDVSNETKLGEFSFISTAGIPKSLPDALAGQNRLKRINLMAPGALDQSIGSWLGTLSSLESLKLDLSGQADDVVGGFFEGPKSSASNASSDTAISDYGRTSEANLPHEAKVNGRCTAFERLTHVVLAGNAGVLANFLGRVSSPLTQIELIVEDPPVAGEWGYLGDVISENFASHLRFLRIGALKHAGINRASNRGRLTLRELSLMHLKDLKSLIRLEIDLPESVIFTNEDLKHISLSCPSIEELKLCPFARFPTSGKPPRVTLEALASLAENCSRIRDVALVMNASPNETLVESQSTSSDSLRRLHVGHSWVESPLLVATQIAHVAPRLEILRWFHERTRPGFVEMNAQGWERVSEALSEIQKIILRERSWRKGNAETSPRNLPVFVDASVDATEARREMYDQEIQCGPDYSEKEVGARPDYSSKSIDACPEVISQAVMAMAEQIDEEIQVKWSQSTNSEATSLSGTDLEDPNDEVQLETDLRHPLQSLLLPAKSFISLLLDTFILYPLSVPSRIVDRLYETVDLWRAESRGNCDSIDQVLRTEQDPYEQMTVYREQIKWAQWKQEPNPRGISRKQIFAINLNAKVTRRPNPESRTTMADNKKQEKDFTTEVDALLPQVEEHVKAGQLQQGLDKLFALEKQSRNAADLQSTSRLVKAVASHCYDARDYAQLNSSILLLSKKHGQLKGVIQALVEQVMSWLDDIKARNEKDKWLELVEALRSITEGKIFLETPRARVTLMLSQYYEQVSQSSSDPKTEREHLETASDLLSELQVETYSSMERREKTEFILEQMRLLVAVARRKDDDAEKEGKKESNTGEAEWIKVRVGGRKINEDFLKAPENEDIKLKFYDLMIQHALHESAYLDATKYYYKVWETPSVKEDTKGKGMASLEHIVCYIILAPHTNEQSDMLHHLHVDPELAKHPSHYELIKSFVKRELMRWPGVVELYGEFLRSTPVFKLEKRWTDLHTRVIEHNVRVISQYYSSITLSRLVSLLDLSMKETEQTLSRLVVSGSIWARIDRPAGVVSFKPQRSAEDVMNDWSSDMQKLLSLVEKTWMGMNAAQAAQSRAPKDAQASS